MRRRAERGKPNGGPRPYGYRYENGGFVVVEAEAVIVRRIFRGFLAGRSLTAIARDLHREGLPTVRGGSWRQPTVSGIVRNPEYAGWVKNHGELFEGEHEPLIEREAWHQAQTMLASREQKGRGRPPKGPAPVPGWTASVRVRRGDGPAHERRLRDVLLQWPLQAGQRVLPNAASATGGH
jgi:hypothetical protein